MASANIDTRKLKDQAAELLGKSKYEKAAELLEQLTRVEPRDMAHRLKLGDTYRRLGQVEKAVYCYQIAGRHFGDEGQLIKAIGACKVILEIDPKNEEAQRDLAQMNTRRFAKPVLEVAGLKAPKAIGAGARAASELELAAGEQAAAGISAMFETGRGAIEIPPEDEGEPLELDVPGGQSSPKAARPAAPALAPPAPAPRPSAEAKPPAEVRRGPPPRMRPSIELGPVDDLTPVGESGVEQPEELETLDPLEPLDEDMPAPGLAPAPTPTSRARPPGSPQPAQAKSPGPASAKPAPARSAPLAPPAARSAGAPGDAPPARRRAAPAPEIELDQSELIDFEPASKAEPARSADLAGARSTSSGRRPIASVPAQPIADLLETEGDGDGEGEEIELISISSEEPAAAAQVAPPEAKPAPRAAAPPHPAPPRAEVPAATGEELDAAFAAILPEEPRHAPTPLPRRPAVPLFDDLPQQAFVELVNRLSYKRWAPGELILRDGDPGRSFFVIVEGTVRIYKRLEGGAEIPLATLGEGAFFGEMALLSGAPRAANVVAETETELLEISDQVLREVVARYPSVAQSLKRFYRQRLVNNVMSISPMFREFDPAERRSIVERFRMTQAKAGEVLIRESEPSDGLYVVLHGAVRVVKRAQSGQDVELARLKEGELFGEMSLLTNDPASATVSAIGPTILLKLHRDHFQELILTHPQILELISDLTDKRQKEQATLSGRERSLDGMSFI